MPSELGYWAVRGFGNPIRLLLAYVGEDFNDKQYQFGPAPDYDKKEWRDVKETFELDFPNLPYYIDDNVKLSQTVAILRYIADKYNMGGKASKEKIRIDLAAEETKDLFLAVGRLCYDQQFEELKTPFLKETLPAKLKQFEAFLGDNTWLVGDTLTFVDFYLVECIDICKLLDASCLDAFPKLSTYVSRYENLPAVKEYKSSGRYISWPVWSPQSSWGFK